MREKQKENAYKILRKKEGGEIQLSLGLYHGWGDPDMIILIA